MAKSRKVLVEERSTLLNILSQVTETQDAKIQAILQRQKETEERRAEAANSYVPKAKKVKGRVEKRLNEIKED